MNTLRKVQVVCGLLLVILILLLTIAIIPISNEHEAVGKESRLMLKQIEELNLPDDKIMPEVKEEAKHALYEGKKITVVVQSINGLEEGVKKANGKIKRKAISVDKKQQFTTVEIDAEKISEFAQEDGIIRIYPKKTYYTMLDTSIPIINATSFWNEGYNGTNIRVAVLDTGIDKNHPMLKGKVAAERDFSNSGSTNDVYGHGTHVAGIIAGGSILSGAAPGAQLLNAKVIGNDGTGDTVSIIAGIGWAVDNGANIISMSIGAPTGIDEAVEQALKQATEKGVIIVASSGNCGKGCPSSACGSFRGVTMPGNSPNAISIGAVDREKKIACFSSGENIAGIKPDFVAPGVSINSSIPNNRYVSMSGTSMSAPHVSGAIALILNRNPRLKQDDVKRILEKTSLDLGEPGKDTSYGFGLINLAKALTYREDLEFGVYFEKQIRAGDQLNITVNISDDVPVSSVTATITRPDNSAEEIIFKSSGNLYKYNYNNTRLYGNYFLEITAEYGGNKAASSIDTGISSELEKLKSYFTAYFRTLAPSGDLAQIIHFNVSETQPISKNITANISLMSTDSINASIRLQITKNDTVAHEAPVEIVEIQPGTQKQLSINTLPDIPPGEYTMKLLADYNSGSITSEKNITVVDDVPPEVLSAKFKESIQENEVQVINAEIKDNSPISISLILYKGVCTKTRCIDALPEEMHPNYTIKRDGKRHVITVFEHLQKADYGLELKACDTSGNCKPFYLIFNSTPCRGRSILLLKTYEEKSAFEKNDSCISTINRMESETPPENFTSKFDTMIFSTDQLGISKADADAIIKFYNEEGKTIIAEGGEIAATGNEQLIKGIFHASLKEDIVFSVLSSNAESTAINITRNHPISNGLPKQMLFNSSIERFPDSLREDGGTEIAAWSGQRVNGSALLAYEGQNKKSLLIPFSLFALSKAYRELFASNIINWSDKQDMDLIPSGFERQSFAEGDIILHAIVNVSSETAELPKIEVSINSQTFKLENAERNGLQYKYPFQTKLSKGKYAARISANQDFSIKESNYLNNVQEEQLNVYPAKADFSINGADYTYDEGIATISVNVSNIGGIASKLILKATIDNSLTKESQANVEPGETTVIQMQLGLSGGMHNLKIEADPYNTIIEDDESNNKLEKDINLCNKEKLLLIDDNDAPFFSTENPSSSEEFQKILQEEGYCVSVVETKKEGIIKPDGFRLVILSRGNYFGDNNIPILEPYNGRVLLEGADLMLDYESSLAEKAGMMLKSDIMINDTQKLKIREHPITIGVAEINISEEKSPYPDGVEMVDAEIAAEWETNGAAITAKNKTRRTAYYGFALNALEDENTREKLVLNTVKWLLQNSAPTMKLQNLTANEGTAAVLKTNADDPEGDEISQYSNDTRLRWDKNAESFVWETGYDDSGEYSILLTAGDGLLNTTEKVSLTVININRAPTIEAEGNEILTEGETAEFELSSTDIDGENVDFFSNESRFVQKNNKFTWKTSIGDRGRYSIIFGATDGELSSTVKKTLIVNRLVMPMAMQATGIDNNTRINSTEKWLIMTTGTNTDCYYATDICQEECTSYPYSLFSISDGTIHSQKLNTTSQGNYKISIECNNTESSNTTELQFSVEGYLNPTLSDLLPTGIIPIDMGETIFFDTGIINLGQTATGYFNIKWFVDGMLEGYGSHSGIHGAGVEMNGNTQYIWEKTTGIHNITFIVDADNHIFESDESNNQVEYIITVV